MLRLWWSALIDVDLGSHKIACFIYYLIIIIILMQAQYKLPQRMPAMIFTVSVSLQTVSHQLPRGESGKPAFQRRGRSRCFEGCLPAVVQCLSLPGAECAKVTDGNLL